MNFLEMTDLRGLALTSIEVLPHYNRFMEKFEHFEEKCIVYEKAYNVKVIRINDGDGVIVDADEVHVV